MMPGRILWVFLYVYSVRAIDAPLWEAEPCTSIPADFDCPNGSGGLQAP